MMKKIVLSVLFSLFILGFYDSWYNVLGIGSGAIWGCINLYFIKQLMYGLLIEVPKNPFKILIMAFIKFPLLYTVGYALLQINQISPWSQLIGFSIVLAASTQSWFWSSIYLTKEI